jgi:hypothetical protein
MPPGAPDVARIRLDNALLLFDEFVRATAKHADAATLRGLEGRFAERLQIQPSYWSQIKGRSRQIGERLARQFEQLSHKPHGWMDRPHEDGGTSRDASTASSAEAGSAGVDASWNVPKDDDERFIVGLVLTYYRRHPERARERLLALLGEVLSRPAAAKPAGSAKLKADPATPVDDGTELWSRARAAVAPLKRKR